MSILDSTLLEERMIQALYAKPMPRIAYAVHISRLITDSFTTDHPFVPLEVQQHLPPAPLLEAVLLSDYLNLPDGGIASALQRVLSRVPSSPNAVEQNDSDREVYVLLALAGTLRPALLSPRTGAWQILSELNYSHQLQSVYQFTRGIVENTQQLQYVRIDSTVLNAARSKVAWHAESERFNSDIREWTTHAKEMTFLYAPATAVWQRWLGNGGMISSMMKSISSNHDDTDEVERMIRELTEKKKFSDLVVDTDRIQLSRTTGPDIEGPAIDQLYGRAQQAVGLAYRHFSLRTTRPSTSSFLIDELTKLRESISKLKQPALDALNSITSEPRSLFTGAASIAAYAIERFRAFFDGELSSEREIGYSELIASGLFCFPSIRIDDSGCPEGDPLDIIEVLMEAVPETLTASLDLRLRARQYRTVQRLVAWTKSTDQPMVGDMGLRLEVALSSEKKTLRDAIDNTRTAVEEGLTRGYLSDAERSGYDSVLADMERRVADSECPMVEFRPGYRELEEMISAVTVARIRKTREARGALEELDIKRDSEEYRHISGLIEEGDIVTGTEFISRSREGLRFSYRSVDRRREIFNEFFPDRSETVASALASVKPDDVVKYVSLDGEFAGIELGQLTSERRESASGMLEAWFKLKFLRLGVRDDYRAAGNIRSVLQGLDFQVRRVAITRRDSTVGEARVETEALRERDSCPIPAYGSIANGRYRIVFLWDHPVAESILEHADQSTGRLPTMLFYFGSLPNEQRNRLSSLCRENFTSIVLLDESLLLFLCGERDSRLRAFFACSVPFTYIKPYVPTAGLVPPEIFYGRQQEMRQIEDIDGSCFVYGGRQIGKTALLRAVERRAHQPAQDRYAVWIDLSAENVGVSGYPHDIWPVIYRRLRDPLSIPRSIPSPNPNVVGRKQITDFVEYLCDRFDESTGSVLVLLLDQADTFLTEDAKERIPGNSGSNYIETRLLQYLKNRTNNSIKVVFAGLHNVLRTAREPDHPFGQYGKPIVVGPLWESAESLIREPLQSCGYRFEHTNLVTRILAYTNYYPNLIQLYGEALINYISDRRPACGPLYQIDEGAINYVHRSLRETTREKFQLTLQLDARFEVIAYSLAHECTRPSTDGGLAVPRSVDWIFQHAQGWWKVGFEGFARRGGDPRFVSLLDEMVELGVLRSVDHDSYTLRNSNILLLMGTHKEITDTLLTFRERELPPAFNSEVFRAHVDPHRPEGPRRSPLTYQQVNDLLSEYGVSIVCGLPASGYRDVLNFLTTSAADYSMTMSKDKDVEGFIDALKRRVEGRSNTIIYGVDETVPWDQDWVGEALDHVSRLTHPTYKVRVVFVVDPTKLLHMCRRLEAFGEGISWTILRTWREAFLHRWMLDVGLQNTPSVRDTLVDVTGGWPLLLSRLHEAVQNVGLNRAVREFKYEGIRREFGLDGDSLELQRKVLEVLALSGEEMTFTEISRDVGGSIDADVIRLTLDWAELLQLVRSLGEGAWQRWRVDLVVGRVLLEELD